MGAEPVYLEGADKVYKVEMSLWNTSYVMAPGHQLRVVFSPQCSALQRMNLKMACFWLTLHTLENVTAINTIHIPLNILQDHFIITGSKSDALPEVDVLKEIKHELKDVLTEKLLDKVHTFIDRCNGKHERAKKIINKLINH